jgi:hypothetical protein
MPQRSVHQCECARCQSEEDHPAKILHHRMNVFFSRLDEQQRRWYAALEAQRLGHGGATLVSQITGTHMDTIRRGREELEKDLEGRPPLSPRWNRWWKTVSEAILWVPRYGYLIASAT